MIYWDFSQYNAIVKQVEHCSDVLRMTAERISMQTIPPNKTATRLQKHARQAAIELDKRALRMLAIYDPAAREMVRTGVQYDPRRDMFKPTPGAVPYDGPSLWCSDEEARAAAGMPVKGESDV